MNPIDRMAMMATGDPEHIEDLGMVYDRHTKQIIKFKRFLSASEVAKHFRCTKGQLMKAVAKGKFPKATKLEAGNTPYWADTIIDRVTRAGDEEYAGA